MLSKLVLVGPASLGILPTLLLLLKVGGHSSDDALQLLPEDILAHFATQQPHDLCNQGPTKAVNGG